MMIQVVLVAFLLVSTGTSISFLSGAEEREAEAGTYNYLFKSRCTHVPKLIIIFSVKSFFALFREYFFHSLQMSIVQMLNLGGSIML